MPRNHTTVPNNGKNLDLTIKELKIDAHVDAFGEKGLKIGIIGYYTDQVLSDLIEDLGKEALIERIKEL